MNKIITRIYRFFSILIVGLLVGQGAVQAPVACFESDGHINVEIDCKINLCEINIDEEENHVDQCQSCVDIPLWSFNSEYKQAVKASDQNPRIKTFNFVFQPTFNFEQNITCTIANPNLVVLRAQPQFSIPYTQLLL